MKALRPWTASIAVALLAACSSTYDERMAGVRQAYALGNYEAADAELVCLAEEEDASNAHVYNLERAMVQFAMGYPAEAENMLAMAKDTMDEYSTDSFGDYLGATLLDDRQLDYGGEDYERILVRAMLSVANLMGDRGDALAYAHQVLEKQQEIMEAFEDSDGKKPKQSYKLVAFGSYLQGIIREEDPLNLDEARIHFTSVTELEPGFPYGATNLERVTSGNFARPGHGVVQVLALVGRGPYKVEVDEPLSALALSIAQVFWAISRDRATFPNISSVKIPALTSHDDNPTSVVVHADGGEQGITATVTDVETTAHQQFDTMKDWILARAILRRAFKTVVTEGAKEIANQDKNIWADLLISIFGAIWMGSERADTRCWSLLPASFQVLRFELPEGEHEIALQALRQGRPTGSPQVTRVIVRAGFNTYVLALVPTLAGGPPPLSSDPATRTEYIR